MEEINWDELEELRQKKAVPQVIGRQDSIPQRLVGAAESMPIQRWQQSTLTSSPVTIELAETCPTCQGKEWLRRDVPISHPAFGKLAPCPQCKEPELRKNRQEELLRLSNLEFFRDKTFATFDPQVSGTMTAFHAAKNYAANLQGWFLLLGGFGCGKTHLAAAIANEVRPEGGIYFAVVPDLLDYLRAAFDPNRQPGSEGYEARFEQIKNVGLLILDDLGTENQSPWVRQAMFQLINYRYNKRLPVVITTNDFSRSEPRVLDRLFDRQLCKAVQMSAGSYRSGH